MILFVLKIEPGLAKNVLKLFSPLKAITRSPEMVVVVANSPVTSCRKVTSAVPAAGVVASPSVPPGMFRHVCDDTPLDPLMVAAER